jgi:catechol-2,3-dioxygenase
MCLIDRREFLAWTSAAVSLIVAHRLLPSCNSGLAVPPSERPETGPRLLRLELLTSVPLVKMKDFYQRTLGLRLLDETPNRLTFAAGQTRLTFALAGADDGQPFYHFAFNIPENKVLAAWTWQKERTPLLPIPANLRDAAFPDDIVHYRHWNAHSIFFFDPAGNVVEYIARHDLKNQLPGAFTSDDIRYASEIGFIVDDVPAAAATLQKVVGLTPYRGASAQFTALGDEHGLLLVMKRGQIISFDAPDKKAVTVFRTSASVRGLERTTYHFPNFPYEIRVEG